jgi:hypothetical protein
MSDWVRPIIVEQDLGFGKLRMVISVLLLLKPTRSIFNDGCRAPPRERQIRFADLSTAMPGSNPGKGLLAKAAPKIQATQKLVQGPSRSPSDTYIPAFLQSF